MIIFGVMTTGYVGTFLALERVIATLKVRHYETQKRPYFAVGSILLMTITSASIAYREGTKDLHKEETAAESSTMSLFFLIITTPTCIERRYFVGIPTALLKDISFPKIFVRSGNSARPYFYTLLAIHLHSALALCIIII
ncbi:hypothetical protein DdX_09652 [Ditylenchus destructor]|uniref:Uncharacterized protein n=1 Tax=Ditylenchus destructor TaxID=166010 RepID=A0AAD4N0G4_9BILA|nr:hypothetical protein DdX_09652 [Ditylenchus destructor]